MKKPIVLIGQSGSGKTTLGKTLAAALGSAFCDLDTQLVETSGKSIEELIANGGEPNFRNLETAQLESALLAGYEVISTGGGAVLAQKNRDLLRQDAYCIWLDCDVVELARRVEESYSRPLLEGQSLQESLMIQRKSRLKYYFLAADAIVDVTKIPVDELTPLVTEVAQTLDAKVDGQKRYTEKVELWPERGYSIHVGRGLLADFDSLAEPGASKLAVISQEEIDFSINTSVTTKRFEVDSGESAKSLTTVQNLCSAFSEWGLTRNDAIVAIGGGVITDLGGFTAASYHRGVPVYQVPTTLLAQIDAAIGGKCGVNLPQGKNLVGAYWQPDAVICDLATLDTLPAEEFRNGLGELVKYQFLLDTVKPLGVSFDDLGGEFSSLPLTEMIAACARIKAAVVSGDEREADLRAILNYGHTLGHALEAAQNYTVKHGSSVATGLIFAAELAFELGRISRERVNEHYKAVRRFGFETTISAELNLDEIVQLFSADKKALSGITFVLDGENGIESVVVEDEALLMKCLKKMVA